MDEIEYKYKLTTKGGGKHIAINGVDKLRLDMESMWTQQKA